MPSVKPGVSAKAEIIVTNIPDALSVPIQAITSYKGKPAVYQVTGSKSEPRPVEVGMFNTKFIEIVKGLEPGDRVMLAPPFNSQEKDLEGAVLTAEEKAKLTATARKPIPTPPNQPGSTSPALGQVGTAAGGRGQGADGARPLEDRSLAARFGLTQEELLKRFNKDGDGKLNEEELAAMRESLGERRRGTERQDGERRRAPREGAPAVDNHAPASQPANGSADTRHS